MTHRPQDARSSLPVEVLFQVGRVKLNFRPLLRPFQTRAPQDRIDDPAAAVLVAPVAVEVPAGETKTAPALGPLQRPRNNRLAAGVLLGVRGAAHSIRGSRLED